MKKSYGSLLLAVCLISISTIVSADTFNILDVPASTSPTGAAGGALTGTYPNPTIAAATDALYMHLAGTEIITGVKSSSVTSVASTPAMTFNGAWFTGGSATSTKPHFLIEPSSATSTGWSTTGTGLGVNSASGFTGKLIDLQVNGGSVYSTDSSGITVAGAYFTQTIGSTASARYRLGNTANTGLYSQVLNSDVSIVISGTLRAFANASGWNMPTAAIVGSAGTAITQIKYYSQTLTPASIPAGNTAEQTFTVTGLTTADFVVVSTTPANPGTSIGICNSRVSAADTLAITFCNVDLLTTRTPTSQTYVIRAERH